MPGTLKALVGSRFAAVLFDMDADAVVGTLDEVRFAFDGAVRVGEVAAPA